MKVSIIDQKVKFDDEKGNITTITTDQLLEMVGILNTAILDGDRFYFETLEFTV